MGHRAHRREAPWGPQRTHVRSFPTSRSMKLFVNRIMLGQGWPTQEGMDPPSQDGNKEQVHPREQ